MTVVVVALVGVLALAPAASAVVVRAASGQVFGVMPHRGVSPKSFAGSVAAGRPNAPLSNNGNLNYHSGPVLHSSAPFLIFWDPNSAITPKSQSVLEQYLTDVAAASAAPTNVYGVLRQYTDSSGFAAASQTFSGAQAIVDSHAYPAKSSPCTTTNCVTDIQIQVELTRLISTTGLPTGAGANAPIYFVVTPASEDVCGAGLGCASSGFCAYHSSFSPSGSTVLYSSIPLLPVFSGTKGCQTDNPANTVFQQPNGDRADNAADDLSHENSEAITDPVAGGGWWDTATGQEVGDNCESWGSTVSPATGQNPNDYLPVLGGSEPAGTLFDQLINGNHYYTQTEWSNGDVGSGGCEAQPSAATLAPSFTTTAPATPGTTVSFDPSASTSTGGFTSATWTFGDGSADSFTRGTPPAISHLYSQAGTYTATLTLVDNHGNLATDTQNVVIAARPTAAFTISGPAPAGSPISFNAGGSSDPNAGGSISSYSWSFGDGSAAGAGVAPAHAFSAVGNYTVTLTVTASSGMTATVSHVVSALPTAAFTVTTPHPTSRQSVSFSAAGSRDPGGAITAYAWSFGDGASGSGATPAHTYTAAGSYPVTLTITDQSGLQSSTSTTVKVALAPPVALIKITKIAVRGKQLSITVSGAGTLELGNKHVKVNRAGTIRITIPLTAAQKRRLKHKHKLTVTLKITLVNASGSVQHIRERVTLRG